jgi:hypothetical protein
MNGWTHEDAPLEAADGLRALPWVILVACMTVIVAMVVL